MRQGGTKNMQYRGNAIEEKQEISTNYDERENGPPGKKQECLYNASGKHRQRGICKQRGGGRRGVPLREKIINPEYWSKPMGRRRRRSGSG